MCDYYSYNSNLDWITRDPEVLLAWFTRCNTTPNSVSLHRLHCKSYKRVFQAGRIGGFERGAQDMLNVNGKTFPSDFTGMPNKLEELGGVNIMC